MAIWGPADSGKSHLREILVKTMQLFGYDVVWSDGDGERQTELSHICPPADGQRRTVHLAVGLEPPDESTWNP
jgi:hypothetical protein